MASRSGPERSLSRSTNRALLSPDDAHAIHAQRRPEDVFRPEVNARFYQQIKAESKLRSASLPEPLINRIPDPPRSTPITPRRSESHLRPSSICRRSKSRKSRNKEPRVDFRKLPYTVFQCILDQLRMLHNERLSPTCSTCYMRDLAAMRLTCSAWDTDTRKRLYEHIDISGPDSPEQLRKYRM
jgi:hypothetical protein